MLLILLVNLVVKTEDIVVCFNLLELENLQQRLEEVQHSEVTASQVTAPEPFPMRPLLLLTPN